MLIGKNGREVRLVKRSGRSELCWTFTETDEHDLRRRTYRFDFSYIRSERLRRELQDYIWYQYRSREKMPATLRQEHSWLKYYEAWLNGRRIDSLFEICRADVEGFLTYLHTCISPKTGQPLRLITQKHIYDTVRGVYRWYCMKQPQYATVAQLFPTDVYQRINRVTHTTCVPAEDVTRFLRVVEHVENPCLCCGATILAVTGLAPGDLLGLRTDCIQISEKGASLRYYHHRKRMFRTIPVNDACVRAVQALKEQTDALRRNAPEESKSQLFLHRNKWKQVTIPSPDLFRYWMRCAQADGQNKKSGEGLKNVEPPDKAGDLVMTPTLIRDALLWDMWERNVPYMVIREFGGHPLFSERGDVV